jgi:predicted phage terminase large subunit-like protein
MKYVLYSAEEVALLEEDGTDWMDSEQLGQYRYSKGRWDMRRRADYLFKENGYMFEEEKLDEIPDHWIEIWNDLDLWIDINLIEPRGHGKTTAILLWILHKLVYKIFTKILYLASEDLGQLGIGRIRGELETNPRLLRVYWNLVPVNSDDMKDKRLKRWKAKEIQLLNWTLLKTTTKNKPIRWQRFARILVDDPEENKDVMNKKNVKKFQNYVFTSLYGCLMPGWTMTLIWTIVWSLCLVKHARDILKRKTIEHEACDAKFENILWPALWSRKSLLARRQKLWTKLFNQEYRNIPIQSDDALIETKWIKHRERKPLTFDMIVVSLDPKSSLKDAWDYAGFAVLWFKENKAYVLYAKGMRLSPGKAQVFAKQLFEKYKANYILKEDNIERGITERLIAQWLPIRSILAVNDKFTRLVNASSRFEFWNIIFNPDWSQQEAIDQITTFPDTEFDDQMDAIIQALLRYKQRKGKNNSICRI